MVQVSNDVFRGHGIQVKLATPDDFLKVRETLTRIGIKSATKEGVVKSRLVQSVFLLHKRGKYAIMHFKELFMLDGKKSDITDDDYLRRDRIAELLEDWGLCTLLQKSLIDNVEQSPKLDALFASIKIVPFSEKGKWEFVQKYHIGNA